MRIAAMAAGAVGGYFGARMAAAGHDVHFIARGTLLEAIRNNGLKIESTLGDLHMKNAKATSDPKEVGPVDVVLFAVKLWDTETAAEHGAPAGRPSTRVITLQNGVDSVERIAPILGADHDGGRQRLYRQRDDDAGRGFAHQPVRPHGVRPHRRQARRATRRLCRRGEDRPTSTSPFRPRWTSSAGRNSSSWSASPASTAAMRQPLGPILADPDTRAFLHQISCARWSRSAAPRASRSPPTSPTSR